MRARGDSLAREKTGEPSQKYGVAVKDGDAWYLYFYDTIGEQKQAVETYCSLGYECQVPQYAGRP